MHTDAAMDIEKLFGVYGGVILYIANCKVFDWSIEYNVHCCKSLWIFVIVYLYFCVYEDILRFEMLQQSVMGQKLAARIQTKLILLSRLSVDFGRILSVDFFSCHGKTRGTKIWA